MCVSVCEVEANTGASATCQTVDSGSKLLQRRTGLNRSALFSAVLCSFTHRKVRSVNGDAKRTVYWDS